MTGHLEHVFLLKTLGANLALPSAMAHIAAIELRRTTWPRRAPRVGLTTFSKSRTNRLRLARGLLYTPT